MKLSTKSSINCDREIKLVSLAISDSQAYFELIDRNRNYLRRWLGWIDSIRSTEDVETDIRKRLIAYFQCKKCLFGIFYNGTLVGRITFSKQIGEVNIGYFIDEAHQGKGITTRALATALNFGFTELGVHRFILACQDDNLGSKAIANRLGFEFEGVAKQKAYLYNKYFDLNIYSLINTTIKIKRSNRDV